MFTRSVMFTY